MNAITTYCRTFVPTVRIFAKRLLFATLMLCLFSNELHSQTDNRAVHTQVERGITGTIEFRYSGKPLKVKPQRDSEPALVMRLSAPSKEKIYEARFLGSIEGIYDLSGLVEHDDGSAVVDLPPLSVEIVSTLPKDHRSDLFEAATFKPKILGGYRLSLCLIVLIWMSIPILFFIRKATQPKPVVVPPVVEASPTFADQLKPLVEAAAAGTLSVRDKGRLELLLVHYWRERISLQGVDIASAIRQLRLHPEAGRLVTTVEQWLHQSGQSVGKEDCSPESILELLKPYRAVVSRSSAE